MVFREESIFGLKIIHKEDEERLLEFVNEVYALGKDGYPQYFIEEMLEDYDMGFSLEFVVDGVPCMRSLGTEFCFSKDFRTAYNQFASNRKREILEKVLSEEIYNDEYFKARNEERCISEVV